MPSSSKKAGLRRKPWLLPTGDQSEDGSRVVSATATLNGAATQNKTPEPDIPQHLLDPISMALHHDPVVIESGRTYDRSTITEWFERGGLSDPYTGEKLGSRIMITNWSKREDVQRFLDDYPGFVPDGWETRELAPVAKDRRGTGDREAAAETTFGHLLHTNVYIPGLVLIFFALSLGTPFVFSLLRPLVVRTDGPMGATATKIRTPSPGSNTTRPAEPMPPHGFFGPNRIAVSTVILPNGEVLTVSNDFGASCYEKRHFLDLALYKQLFEDEQQPSIKNLYEKLRRRWTGSEENTLALVPPNPPCSEVRGTRREEINTTNRVLGMIPRLGVSLLGRNAKNLEVSLLGVLVVEDLPVPLHISSKSDELVHLYAGPFEEMVPGRVTFFDYITPLDEVSGGAFQKQFPERYRNHVYWQPGGPIYSCLFI